MAALTIALVVVIAFVAAFRNTSMNDKPPTLVRVGDVPEGDAVSGSSAVDVVLAGKEYLTVSYFTVRSDGVVHVLWDRNPHLGCAVKPADDVDIPHRDTIAFTDPCDGSQFALDGRCVEGPCPRGLDEFRVVERGGVEYFDLAHLQRGAAR